MADDQAGDRSKQIEAFRAAAHIERAQTLRRFLQGLLGRRDTTGTWRSLSKPALAIAGDAESARTTETRDLAGQKAAKPGSVWSKFWSRPMPLTRIDLKRGKSA